MGLIIAAFVFVVIVIAITVVAWFLLDDLFYEEHWRVTATMAIFVIGILIVGGMTWFNWATTYRNDHWKVCQVTGKDRGGDEGSYRIYTENCGQLSNEDSILRTKFRSADIWQDIPDKGEVKLRIAGSRIPLFSHFPNIFDARTVK